MSKRRLRAVEVEWVDSVLHDGGWVPVEAALHAHEMTICRSIGYLVKKTKDDVTLCGSVHLNNIAGVVTIPRSAVRKMVYLDEPSRHSSDQPAPESGGLVGHRALDGAVDGKVRA